MTQATVVSTSTQRRAAQQTTEYVMHMAKEHDVRFIRLWFSDILGQLKSVAISIDELEEALREGVGFDGSAIEGFVRINESDMVALPDPNTFALLPWRPKENAVARMFCDMKNPGGKPFEGDSRYVLQRTIARAAKMGYTYYVGPELEYFYLKSLEDPQPIDQGGYFDLTPHDTASDLRRETILALEEMGIAVEYSHHEAAPSQHEIDFRYMDALTMADNVMTHRLVTKEIAHKHGVYATFMPKPFAHQNGSGMHVNISLFQQGERNAFFDKKDPLHLSKTAKYFIAGVLKHAREFTLVTNPWVNSYKRLTPGYEAPVYLTWALRSRSDLVRIPTYRQGHEQSTRVELRSPDSSCNPYLAFAVILAAGLDGIEQKYPLPARAEENVIALSDAERVKRKIGRLPMDLHEAIEAAHESPFLKRALGDHVFNSLISNKQLEWDRFCATVTDYELEQYLPRL
jgi:glutamine synthetase